MGTYYAIKAFCTYTTMLFFRQIEVISPQNVPEEGPMILYGNHNNQFIDGMLLVSKVKRKISFIAAAVSVRRYIIGWFLKSAHAIPVERAQDLAKKGEGKISKIYNGIIYGQKTKFKGIGLLSTLKIGKQEVRVDQIINDQQIKTTTKNITPIEAPSDFKVIPKIQYDQFYNNVYDALRDGKCVGIFPQGGSHDNPEHLPFKAGICIMALGAMEKYGIQVSLVPAGFNYYNPQKFRSKAFLQFGIPYKVPKQMVQLYKTDKRKAVKVLLEQLQKRLKQVTTETLTYEQLYTLFFSRTLYTHMVKKKLNVHQKIQLNRRFIKAYNKLINEPQLTQFKEFYEQLNQFRLFTSLNGFSLITRKSNHLYKDIIRFVFHLLKSIVRIIVGLPGVILMGPIAKLIIYQAQKQRQRCLKNSSVKISAADVVASYKVLLASIYFPVATIIYTIIFLYILHHFAGLDFDICKKYCLLLPIFMPIYGFVEVKTYDSLSKHWTKLKYLFIRLFKRDIYDKYETKKAYLSQKLLKFIDKYGQEVIPGFKKERIVQPQQISPLIKKTKKQQ